MAVRPTTVFGCAGVSFEGLLCQRTSSFYIDRRPCEIGICLPLCGNNNGKLNSSISLTGCPMQMNCRANVRSGG